MRFLLFLITQEVDFQNKRKDHAPGDQFVSIMGSFVKMAQFSLSELEDSWKDMKQRVSGECNLQYAEC